VAYNPGLDVEQIEDLLVHLRGPGMHPRLARLRAMIATRGGGG
jgi:phage tail tape-measure protein